jgi:hypothetical protein
MPVIDRTQNVHAACAAFLNLVISLVLELSTCLVVSSTKQGKEVTIMEKLMQIKTLT